MIQNIKYDLQIIIFSNSYLKVVFISNAYLCYFFPKILRRSYQLFYSFALFIQNLLSILITIVLLLFLLFKSHIRLHFLLLNNSFLNIGMLSLFKINMLTIFRVSFWNFSKPLNKIIFLQIWIIASQCSLISWVRLLKFTIHFFS